MNDNSQTHSGNPVMGPLIGFALGAVVGGTLALLMAPDSGERTRRRLGVNARRTGRDVRHSVDDARNRVSQAVTGLGADIKAAVDAGRGAFQQQAAAREGHDVSQIAPGFAPSDDGQA